MGGAEYISVAAVMADMDSALTASPSRSLGACGKLKSCFDLRWMVFCVWLEIHPSPQPSPRRGEGADWGILAIYVDLKDRL